MVGVAKLVNAPLLMVVSTDLWVRLPPQPCALSRKQNAARAALTADGSAKSNRRLHSMNEIVAEKYCNRCEKTKPLSEFYLRSGKKDITNPDHLLQGCRECRKKASSERQSQRLPNTQPAVLSEILVINYLKQKGIPSLPGKAVKSADVDVVAYGCVWIECKYSQLAKRGGGGKHDEFLFVTTPRQQQTGLKANVVVLICEYPDGRQTFHFFPANHPVFYMDGRVKSGFTFRPGRTKALKFGNSRTVMTQSMMDGAQDATWLIKDALNQIEQKLMAGEVLPFELNQRAS